MHPVARRDIIVIGGSAGAIHALAVALQPLPEDFTAALFIAIHRSAGPTDPTTLAHVLTTSHVPVHHVEQEAEFSFGHAYVAPPDNHLVLEHGVMMVEQSPRESRFRPSIDVLFKSAATSYGKRAIGVILSGAWDMDGPAGLWQIKNRGGVAIVQDPADAAFDTLPRGAIARVAVDHVVPAQRIGEVLIGLTSPGAAADPAGTRRPRILIVEDESVVANNLQHSLALCGFDPFDWVPTGEQAIAIAGQERPDLILMDIHLAGSLNGIEAARRIWHTLQIPIVYCTALSDLETLRQAQATESYGYVVKPFHSEGVRVAIELALARREKELRR